MELLKCFYANFVFCVFFFICCCYSWPLYLLMYPQKQKAWDGRIFWGNKKGTFPGVFDMEIPLSFREICTDNFKINNKIIIIFCWEILMKNKSGFYLNFHLIFGVWSFTRILKCPSPSKIEFLNQLEKSIRKTLKTWISNWFLRFYKVFWMSTVIGILQINKKKLSSRIPRTV